MLAGQAEQRVEHMQDGGRVGLLLPGAKFNKSGEQLVPKPVRGEHVDGETSDGLAQHGRVGKRDQLHACLGTCFRRYGDGFVDLFRRYGAAVCQQVEYRVRMDVACQQIWLALG